MPRSQRSPKVSLRKHANSHGPPLRRLPTPPLRPMGTVGRRASPSALPSPHTLILPAPVLPPASLPPAPPMPLRGMEAHVFAACSRCAASLAPLATLGSSDAVGAAESGLCFGVRLRPAIHSPGGGAGAFTDSSKVRSRHTSLNSHACRTLYTVPLSCVLLVAEDSQCGDLRVLTGAAGALRKGEYRVRHFAGRFASLV